MADSAVAAAAEGRAGRFVHLRRDVVWNIASLVILAVSGLALQTLVGLFYSPAVLGVFNQVYAAYILGSQLAVLGIHFSVLRAVGQHAADPTEAGAWILSGLLATVAPALVISSLFYLGRGAVGAALGSEAVAEGLAWAAPGLFLFALNKTQLASLNGLGQMRAFAALQALRPVLMVSTFAACALGGASAQSLPILFTVAEAGLFGVAFVCLRSHFALGNLRRRIREHWHFGARGFIGGLLLDLNTRLDVLVLGVFWSDAVVGIYSFAAIFAEGLFQVLVALRNTLNPRLSRVLHPPDVAAYRALVGQVRRKAYLGVGLLGAAAVALYPLAVALIPQAAPYASGWVPFAILIAGVVAASGTLPFSGILLQAGHPGANTWVIVGTTIANGIAALVLVPRLEGVGAAIATASSFVVQVALLKALTQRRLGWDL